MEMEAVRAHRPGQRKKDLSIFSDPAYCSYGGPKQNFGFLIPMQQYELGQYRLAVRCVALLRQSEHHVLL